MKSIPGSMAQRAREIFNEELEVVLPRLMREYQVPHRAAAELKSAPNSVRKWLEARGWVYDPDIRKWVEPAPEKSNA